MLLYDTNSMIQIVSKTQSNNVKSQADSLL